MQRISRRTFRGGGNGRNQAFPQTAADIAFFREKDFQQLHIVRRLVHDLDIPIKIVGCPTVRDVDGLAMSSRNMRLPAVEREIASTLPAVLFDTADQLSRGFLPHDVIPEARRRRRSAGIDYFEPRSEADLLPLDHLDNPARLLVAATLGQTRLIDNVKVIPWTEPPTAVAVQPHRFYGADLTTNSGWQQWISHSNAGTVGGAGRPFPAKLILRTIAQTREGPKNLDVNQGVKNAHQQRPPGLSTNRVLAPDFRRKSRTGTTER
ncbi:pantothenate synthetase domain-containing protein (plasmid) [Sinorhizobium fredii]|uniref:pantoate--beta-alanine ligase (AMP-forming) n=1 Tax=Rhizobium fredii TaxID=380 RepID=A0A2L0HC04_RHIFR|nr:pantothenate synthetase domain-containing protein [Sinorhizobium fredii]